MKKDIGSAAPSAVRIRALNVGNTTQREATALDTGEPRLPLAACDCDNDTCGTDVDVCVAADDVDADVKACGIWG